MRARRASALIAVAVLLAACAATPPRPAARPLPPPPPGAAADAVPRAEPRSSHGNPPFYSVNGRRYDVLASADNYVERGVASWYGPDFQGHSTSSGERYDMYLMTAAHPTLPIPCYARVTNLVNGRSVIVRINDRGPFVANRIVDLSYAAASRLDIVRTGTAFVELRTVGPGELNPAEPGAAGATAAAAPAAPGPAAPAAGAPQTDAGLPPALYIQVGAFANPDNARRVIERLQAGGVAHVFSIPGSAAGQPLRRVRVGPIASVDEFDQLAARLAALGYPEARLAND